MEILGVEPGSVTPFGLINDGGGRATVILDQAMMEQEWLNYHPLRNDATTTIRARDLLAFIRATGHEPRIVAVSEPML
jgi:Ala-tRNA(Pro) deacylase